MDPDPPATSALFDNLQDLCAIDSTSGREAPLLDALKPQLEALGAEVIEQRVDAGGINVLAKWGEPRVLFSTHLDTVPPFLPPRRESGAMHGRGACDAKGQIVAQLAAIRALLASGEDRVAWLGVVREETDSEGAKAALALATELRGLAGLIDGEPTGNRLATGQRGFVHLHLRCTGRAAHSGSPELGRSAAWPLIDWLSRLRQAPLARDAQLGPEVWNLGLMSAGRAINVIPDEAEARVVLRSVPGSTFLEAVAAARPDEGAFDVVHSTEPMRYPAFAGFDAVPVPFGSDLPKLRALVPSGRVALVGPGSIDVAHTEREHLTLRDLEEGVAVNERLARHMLAACPTPTARAAHEGPMR